MSASKVTFFDLPDLVLQSILAELHKPLMSALVYRPLCLVSSNSPKPLPRLKRAALLLTCHHFYDLVRELEDSLAKTQVYGTEQGTLAQESFPCPRQFSRFQRWLPVVMRIATDLNLQPRIDPYIARRVGMLQHRAVINHKTIAKASLAARYLVEGLHWQWRCLEARGDREIEPLLRISIKLLPISTLLAIRLLSLMTTALYLNGVGHSFRVFRQFARKLPEHLKLAVCCRSIECFILSNGPLAQLPEPDGPLAQLPDLKWGQSVPSMFGPISEQVARQASNTAFSNKMSATELVRNFAQLHMVIDARIDEWASTQFKEAPREAREKWNNHLSELSPDQEVICHRPDPNRSFEWTLMHFKELTGTKTALDLVREAREAIGMPLQE